MTSKQRNYAPLTVLPPQHTSATQHPLSNDEQSNLCNLTLSYNVSCGDPIEYPRICDDTNVVEVEPPAEKRSPSAERPLLPSLQQVDLLLAAAANGDPVVEIVSLRERIVRGGRGVGCIVVRIGRDAPPALDNGILKRCRQLIERHRDSYGTDSVGNSGGHGQYIGTHEVSRMYSMYL